MFMETVIYLKLSWAVSKTIRFSPKTKKYLQLNHFTEIVQHGIDNTEKIELPVKSDKILTATVYNQIPIFFSRLNGFISISSSDFDNIDCLSRYV